MKQLFSFSIYKRIQLGAGSETRPVLSCLVGNEPQTQAYVSKGVYCGCRASMQGALSAQGGITKRWGTEWPFFQACLPGEWLPSSWSLAESPTRLLPLTLYLLSGVCASVTVVYDAPAGTAITMNAAWGAWGAQCPRAGGKSVTVRSQNDQVLSKLWQLLTTFWLAAMQNSFSFHQARKQKQRKIRTLPTTQEDSTHGHHQMVNTKIRLIIFFATKDGEVLYSQQKQDWELTVAQIMSFILQNSDLNWRK